MPQLFPAARLMAFCVALAASLFLFSSPALSAQTRFTDNNNGTVTDNQSGLFWLKNANCSDAAGGITKGTGGLNWNDATTWSSALSSGSCGLTDGSQAGQWRLPTADEWKALVDKTASKPALTAGHPFGNVQSYYYWSSSQYLDLTSYAWYMGIDTGIIYSGSKTARLYVWPVRTGTWTLDSLNVFQVLSGFGSQNIGTISAPQQVTLTNIGTTDLPVSASITGVNNTDFVIAPGGTIPCGSLAPTLAAGASCTMQVTFNPTVTGTESANLTISASSKSVNIPLSGSGIATISGKVTDLSTGNPLAGATVTLTGGATTQSDPTGAYSFKITTSSAAAGIYAVTFSKTGYGTVTVSASLVSVSSGVIVDMGMTPPGLLNFSSTSPLPSAGTGMDYNQPLKITGGAAPFTFATVNKSSLPAGLQLNAAKGTISGTPTTPGSSTFTVGVTDQLTAYAERDFTIVVTSPLAISSSAVLPRSTKSASYSTAIAASGGTAPYTYSLKTGTLPAGLKLTGSSGVLTGIPTATGTSSFTIQVSDASGQTTTQTCTLTTDSPLTLTTTRLNDVVVGTPFNQTLAASGGYGAYSWGVYSGTLPTGLTLSPTTGIISGTPATATSQPLVLSLQDSYGRVLYQAFTINVLKPLQILTTSMPNGFVGNLYSENVLISGGIAPFTYSISGQLPAGLVINTTTGVISGTPTGGGLTNVQISVTDSASPTPQVKLQNLAIRVTTTVTITSSAILPTGKSGVPLNPVVLTAKGGTSPYLWSVVGSLLPTGITLDPASGTLAGTPTGRGDFSFTVHVADSAGNATGIPANPDKQFFLHISDSLTVKTGALPNGALGIPYSQTLTASGGLQSYNWAVKTGTLPAGLALNAATGEIAGTPTAKITSSVTFTVTDSDVPPQTAQATLLFDISNTLSISETVIPNARIKQPYNANIRALLGTPPFSWRVSSGTLPNGVTLSQNAGIAVLSGTPALAGSSSFSLEVSDNSTPVQTVNQAFAMIVYPDITIVTNALKTAVRGIPYSDAVITDGGAAPITFSITSGTLPELLILDTATGVISGSVTAVTGSSATFTVQATDSGTPAATVDKQFSVFTIDPLIISTSSLPGALQKAPYGPLPLTASGGLSPYSWSLANSTTLPQGITLSSSGVLSGSPTVCGSFPFTLQVADRAPLATTVQMAYILDVTCSDASCGTAAGGAFSSQPLVNLCSSGIATLPVSTTSGWSWTCPGASGGKAVSCSASKDTSGPLLNVSSLDATASTSASILNVAGTVSDSGSGLKSLTVNNQLVAVTDSSFSTALVLADGLNTITTVATDNAGNSTTDNRTITFDRTVPALGTIMPGDNSVTGKTFITVTGSVLDPASTVTASVNGAPPAGAAMSGSTFNATLNLAAGLNTITITATNQKGISGSVKRTITTAIASPTLSINSPAQDSVTSQNSITISGTVSDSAGSAAVSIMVDGQTFSPALTTIAGSASYGFSQSVNLPTEKTYAVVVTVTDQSGNKATTQRNLIKNSIANTVAKVFMGNNDSFTVSNSGTTVYGGAGNDTVTIANGVKGVILDQNIEQISLPASSGSFAFKQSGNTINIYDASGLALLLTVPVQNSGTQLFFSDGMAIVTLSGGLMTLGGAPLNSASATTLVPTTSPVTLSPVTSTTARIFLGNNDTFTVSSSGTILYGSAGFDAVSIDAGVSDVVLDQNVERINLSGPAAGYRFLQTGNKISVYDTSGTTLIVTVPVQGGANGTTISFSNGIAAALLTGGTMTLGGAPLSSDTARAVVPLLQ